MMLPLRQAAQVSLSVDVRREANTTETSPHTTSEAPAVVLLAVTRALVETIIPTQISAVVVSELYMHNWFLRELGIFLNIGISRECL